ncbi:MAG: RDD family protein [Elusimicrobia bacterium]|nr:RDD family protein [Elusimicrobiota bacterium]
MKDSFGFALRSDQPEPVRARFSERFLAYVFDGLLFVLGHQIFIYGAAKSGYSQVLPPPLIWKSLWVLLYIFYQTFMNAQGRASWGKRLLGLYVVDLEGNPISFSQSFLRAIGYFLSLFCFNLGYLWAFFHPQKRTWHDLLAGTQVLASSPRGPLERAGILLTAFVVFGLLGGLWIRENVLKLFPQEKQAVALAYQGLQGIAKLEAIHRQRFGFYTDDIGRLAQLTGDVPGFRKELLKYVEPQGFELSADKNHFVVSAHARNLQKTKITLTGP